MMEKRFAKLDLAAKEIPRDVKIRYFGPDDAITLIVSWGSTKGALLDALDRLWAEGAKIGYLHVRLINPFPTEEILPYLAKAKRRIGIEMNFGAQLAGIVREHTGLAMTHFILKYNGRPMSNTELYDAIQAVLRKKAATRTVLTRGS
jgi:2-oxoglutarate ferredoxin oxidoreductase subunit alpha